MKVEHLMEFLAKTAKLEKLRTQCMIIGIFEKRQLSPSAQLLDEQSKGYITQILAKSFFTGKLGQVMMLYQVPGLPCDSILLMGCGTQDSSAMQFKELSRKMSLALKENQINEAICALTELPFSEISLESKIRHLVETCLDTFYQIDIFKSKKNLVPSLQKMTLLLETRREQRAADRAIEEASCIGKAVTYVKDLSNTPANICTPTYLANQAEKLVKRFPKLSCAVLHEKEIKALKMGALLAVAQGSIHPPTFITVEYRGNKDKNKPQKPIVLIGKGITFDTGGNSIKPAANMIGMKYDMCGGASVLGVLQAIAELELPLHVIGLIPCAENMPGGTAIRPDDIITTLSGKTVEILNTDAEGRLILCDALTYAERFNPSVVIDIATLTGACLVALGRHASGLLSNNETLAQALLQAGVESLDKCWQLPLWEEYHEALQSNIADIANIGTGGDAGAILGACYLAQFAEKFHWAHLDVAGTACRFTGKDRAATGRPVPLLVQYLLKQCN